MAKTDNAWVEEAVDQLLSTANAQGNAASKRRKTTTASQGHRFGCLFCVTGREAEVADRLQKHSGIQAICPIKKYYFRKKGEFIITEARVFPGYIFFCTDDADYEAEKLERLDGVLRLLRYDSEEWALSGDDAAIAGELFDCGGVIGLSRAQFVNGRLHIIDGFLKPYEKDIHKVDRRHQAAMIKLKLNGRSIDLWLGYTLDEDEADGAE